MVVDKEVLITLINKSVSFPFDHRILSGHAEEVAEIMSLYLD